MNKKIKNRNYRKFLDEGEIKIITEEEINLALKNIKGKHYKEGRALLIALYYTGARPNEILDTQTQDLTREKSYIKYKVKGSKGGLARTIYLPFRLTLVKELYYYVQTLPPNYLVFFHYRSNYTRTTIKNGERITKKETTAKLGYYFKKWFTGVVEDSISPYYLRHNRFSSLSEKGASMQDIRMLKGSKTTESVTPYIHLSSKAAKSMAKKIK